ncbi:hypothetical protein MJO29_009708 [Puccinia striiformis f. sp. tritici]|nr:hypothetical protein MJO29_009708 [Puccinia striiformis f. sp. tritici]
MSPDPADLHISFQTSLANYVGSTFLKSTTSTETTMAVAMMYLEVIAPPAEVLGSPEFKTRILNRLKKEVDDWINSSFRFTDFGSSAETSTTTAVDQSTASPGLTSVVQFSDVIPVIEYRQMQYGSHALDGNIVVAPYGVM